MTSTRGSEMGVASPDIFRSIAYYAPETSQRSGAPLADHDGAARATCGRTRGR